MGLLFALQGAPDLALTQFAIETLGVALFVLVLRFLPERFEHRSPPRLRTARAIVAVAVAAAVFLFAMASSTARVEAPSGPELTEAAPEAGGSNVVNVILVDLRGTDTFGEIAVLLTAAVGAVSLARFSVRAGSRLADQRAADRRSKARAAEGVGS
jgi:multicomponent Na+:H+ antiporter subunit A